MSREEANICINLGITIYILNNYPLTTEHISHLILDE